MPRPPTALFLVLAATLALPPVAARAAGDAAEGRRIAERWCVSCHAVAPKGTGPDAAPPFAALAADPAKTEGYLRAWLQAPHPPMPDLQLTRNEIENLVAYIRALAPARGKSER